jgi:hypothetical protein
VHSNILCAHLEVWILSSVVMYLARRFTRRWLDHLLHELPNYIQDLVEIAGYSIYGSPECVVHNSEPLIMANDMTKHINFLFHTGVDAIM